MDHGRGLAPGTVVGGYRIESTLGAGGFGVTYQARSIENQSLVALKEYVPSGLCTRPPGSTEITPAFGPAGEVFKRGLSAFIKEAETLGRLNHPSIVEVTGFFEGNGTAYMALAYLEGGSMARWLDELGRRPTQDELDAILLPITDALTHVHALFILHRDIKPDNIMLTADGTPVLIDFGAIKSMVSSETRSVGSGALNLVTDGYAPPEQYVPDGEVLLGPWTDIYALGATVYRAITGTRMVPAQRRLIDDTHRPLAAMPPDDIGTGWRRDFLQGIDSALALKRSDRPQSASEFRQVTGLTRSARKTMAYPAASTALPAHSPSALTFDALPSSSGAAAPAGARQAGRGFLAAGLLLLASLTGAGAWYFMAGNVGNHEPRDSERRPPLAAAANPQERPQFAGRDRQPAAAIDPKREEKANAARLARLQDLRRQISRETRAEILDRIAVDAPELAVDIEQRKTELLREAREARLNLLRQRISSETSPSELDRIAAEEPAVKTDVDARKLLLHQQAGHAYSKAGNVACFNDAKYPDSWRAEAPLCTPYGCNFGKLSQEACLALGARKGSLTVIHGNAGTTRANECWLQHSCGDLRPHREFTYFKM